ncbi:MAG: hypothetical protein FIO03_09545, partial [Nitrosopumilales archaeon]|nr:hypothetical protein [Nitrosopumilales archaeon]
MEGLLISGNADGGDIALATDFYELTMAAAYYYRYSIRPADKATSDSKSEKGVFEMFVRKLPRNRS